MIYPLKRILICLDLTETDDILIQYAAMFARTVDPDMLYFIHCTKTLEIPEELRREFPEMSTPLDESLSSRMEESISRYIDRKERPYDIGVKDGDAVDNILKWANIKQADLIIMGRKPNALGSGRDANRIANVSPSSVMLVPHEAKLTLNKVFVPIDFSSYSYRAIQRAVSISQKNKAKVVLQNVYNVPIGYHSTGKSFSDFAAIMRRNAEKSYARFLKKHELSDEQFTFVTTLDEDIRPADKIAAEATRVGADLIMIGSRGRTTAAALLLGSIAVALLSHSNAIPCFIVKNKTENMGFFKALMKL